jgi:putative ABC transport system permease protein
LQTRLGVESIMAGIIVNTGLYTINLAVMGFSSNMSLVKTDTVFSLMKSAFPFLGSWYKLVLAAVVIVLAGTAMTLFLGTRLGLSIRATGDNAAMVRASSINPALTITVGLCISGSLTALSGGLLAQYQKSCDINVGTGMVTIALASLIIGETLVGKGNMLRRVLGVVFGSCLYRFIVAVALRFNVPAAAMKLVSSLIVAVAISMPAIQAKIAFEKRKKAARAKHAEQAQKEAV